MKTMYRKKSYSPVKSKYMQKELSHFCFGIETLLSMQQQIHEFVCTLIFCYTNRTRELV